MEPEDKLFSEVARLAAITDRLEAALEESRKFDIQFAVQCSERHSQIQRDLGNITGRATGASAIMAFLVPLVMGIIVYLFGR